ncbi:hypothetical protein AVEN_24329-1 [Araneus ventricosus]|uniref:Metalloendopeptidase n=1 Tax=Araneus ventricosus TaxID=182803 RepID=A0A4Y2PAR9_ARAVE|nr:hypothetical protein AVEN_24329-1 [Araneus ventricosus]
MQSLPDLHYWKIAPSYLAWNLTVFFGALQRLFSCVTGWIFTSKLGQEHNFQKTHPSEEMIFTKYDYESIMHYGDFAFSKRPGVYKTMEAKHSKHLFEPYDKPGLNENDIEMVKKLYKCE